MTATSETEKNQTATTATVVVEKKPKPISEIYTPARYDITDAERRAGMSFHIEEKLRPRS